MVISFRSISWLAQLALLIVMTVVPKYGNAGGFSNQLIWDGRPPLAVQEQLGHGAGFKILWWNIEDGQASRALAGSPLDANLSALARSPDAPDMVVLAEYSANALSDHTKGILYSIYEFSAFVAYSPDDLNAGLMIFSKAKFAMTFLGYLDWVPPDASPERQNQFRKTWSPQIDYFTRPLFVLKIPTKSGSLDLVPVHLLDPWRRLKQDHGSLFTGMSILAGTHQPLWYQIGRLKNALAARFGSPPREPFLLFGDFNTPERLGATTLGYLALSRGLVDQVPGNKKTFPARSSVESQSFPPVSIDHVFATPGLSAEVLVLPLMGSDHYALYIGLPE